MKLDRRSCAIRRTRVSKIASESADPLREIGGHRRCDGEFMAPVVRFVANISGDSAFFYLNEGVELGVAAVADRKCPAAALSVCVEGFDRPEEVDDEVGLGAHCRVAVAD